MEGGAGILTMKWEGRDRRHPRALISQAWDNL